MYLKTAKDLYDFYAAIPWYKWTTGKWYDGGKSCAIGHLAKATHVDRNPHLLSDILFRTGESIIAANDAGHRFFAKRRVLKHLKKAMEMGL